MLDWLQRMLRPDPGAPPPPPGVLTLYGLPDGQEQPSEGTPSLVLPDFDPVDASLALSPVDAPAIRREPAAVFRSLLDAVDLSALRDPNSRARLGFVRRWLDEVSPAAIAWLAEPEETAGDGVSWASVGQT